MIRSSEDDALACRAREGDRDAFELLVSSCRGRLAAMIRARLTGEHEVEADDVVQETLLRAFRCIHRFRARGPDSFLRWLRAIAEHVILDLARRRAVRRRVPLDKEPEGACDSPSKDLRRHERFDRLQEALDHLGDDQRKALLLAHVEGLRTDEIACRMNRTPEAVRQLMWRALKKLRERFTDTESLHLPARSLSTAAQDGGGDERQP